jgi:hypothetical protein
MAPCDKLLTEEECKRNSHGPMLIYTYIEKDLGMEKMCLIYNSEFAYIILAPLCLSLLCVCACMGVGGCTMAIFQSVSYLISVISYPAL